MKFNDLKSGDKCKVKLSSGEVVEAKYSMQRFPGVHILFSCGHVIDNSTLLVGLDANSKIPLSPWNCTLAGV